MDSTDKAIREALEAQQIMEIMHEFYILFYFYVFPLFFVSLSFTF